MKAIQSVRGMNDLLPLEANLFLALSNHIANLFADYQFEPIILPIVEKTELFSRGIGGGTDIIEKEMYTFLDRNNESLSLRPEGTAGMVRSALEHGLIHNQIRKFWYQGQMFRHERPQKGRYRQFYQVGAEIFGAPGPDVEAETLLMLSDLWRGLGIAEFLTLEINTIGTLDERQAFRSALIAFLKPVQAQLDPDSQRRLQINPLRILDSKEENTQSLLEAAPSLLNFLSSASLSHFEKLQTYLQALNISFVINPKLVRGLDYYSHTVFEWTTPQLGAQATVCAGGRYDSLVTQLGGKATPAFGFAMGAERLMLLTSEANYFKMPIDTPDVYIMNGSEMEALALQTSQNLRKQGFRVAMNIGGGSFKSQFKRADQSGAIYAINLQATQAEILYLRSKQPNESIPHQAILSTLQRNLNR